MIEKIERMPLREIWKHEAIDFTKWLEENIDILNDSLNFNLSNAEREQNAGDFNIDIVAEDDNGDYVIIENQLEKSDHNHLGKLITYLTAINAKRAIWIVSEPRQEHMKAISWLNEETNYKFYLLKIEAIKIGESSPAPLFTTIVEPSEEYKSLGVTKKELADREIIRHEFWSALLEKSKTMTKLHSNISPTIHNWIGTSAGKRGMGFNYTITQHDINIELYIDRGKESEEDNKNIFNNLFNHKEEIENKFENVLNWQRLETKRACRISYKIGKGGYIDRSNWESIHEESINKMIKFEKALKQFVKELDI